MADLLLKAFKFVIDAIRPLADPEVRSEILTSVGVPANDATKIELLTPATSERLAQLALTPDEELTAELTALASGAGDLLTVLDSIRDAAATIRLSDQLSGGEMTLEQFLHVIPNFLVTNYLRLRNPGAWSILRLLQFIDDRAALPFGETFNGQRWKALFVDDDDEFRFFQRDDDRERAWNSIAMGTAAVLLGKFGHRLVGIAPGLGDTPQFPVPIQFRAYAGWDPSPFASTPRADRELFHFTTLDILALRQRKDPVEDAASLREERALRLTMVVPPKPIEPAFLARVEGELVVGWRFKGWDFALEGRGSPSSDGLSSHDVSVKASREGRLEPLRLGRYVQLGDLHFSGWMSSARGLGVRLEARGNTLEIPIKGERDPISDEALGEGGAKAVFDLDMQLDSEKGFRFGPSGIVADVPIGQSVGPARIQHLRARIGPSQDGDALEISAAVGLRFKLGPLTAIAEGVGFLLRADGSEPANLGLFHLEAGFKPPEGVGLSLDAGLVKGTGYLGKDAATDQYVGVFEVELEAKCMRVPRTLRLAITGLLATRTPDGAKVLSLFLQGGVHIDPGVPVGGLSLTRIGVVFGYNRRFDLDAFRAGIKTGLLEALLAPPDPLANLARTVSQLTTLFPPSRGSHTVAITARFSRTEAVTLDLGLLYDTSKPSHLVAAARIQIDCRQAGTLKLAAVGVLDLGGGELVLEAHLYDSKLGGVQVEGGAALLVRWESPRTFVLAIGGFHKDYRGPERSLPVFSRLSLFTLKMPSTPVLKVTMTGYFAVTPGTLQFGGSYDVFVGIERLITLEGGVAFDALFEFEPFYFDAEVAGRVKLKVVGKTILGARLEARLRGPKPVRVSGKVTFEVLWWDVSKSFDRSVGGVEPPPPPAVDPIELIRIELQNPRVWEAGALPADAGSVRLAQKPAADRLLLHPLRSLGFVQDAVPLELPLDKVGGRPVAESGVVQLVGVAFGGTAVTMRLLKEQFSRGRYQKLTKERLFATPAFEDMTAGAMIASESAVVVGEASSASTGDFEEIRLGSTAPAAAATLAAGPSVIPMEKLLARSARAQAMDARAGIERFLAGTRLAS